jgi:hypothetical protein
MCATRHGRSVGSTKGVSALDGLVFCGGIGQNAAPIRSRIVDGLDYLGLRIDAQATPGACDIGCGAARILVIPTERNASSPRPTMTRSRPIRLRRNPALPATAPYAVTRQCSMRALAGAAATGQGLCPVR